MSSFPVSIHPYFKAHPGKLEEIKALLPEMVKKSGTEQKILQYEFTIHDDEIFCRESYQDAAGVLAHLSNVGDLLNKLLTMSDLIRLELHGPAGELETLREPLASFQPAWFVVDCGMEGRK
jgi:quinol monooxygenase YgiN